MRKRKLINHKYYIVDISQLGSIFHYDYPFEDPELAQIVVDYYLSGMFTIVRGTRLRFQSVKSKTSRFPKFSPKALKRYKTPHHRIKSLKMAGTGIRTHKFKRLWEPLPTDSKERERVFKKDRSSIRSKILK